MGVVVCSYPSGGGFEVVSVVIFLDMLSNVGGDGS